MNRKIVCILLFVLIAAALMADTTPTPPLSPTIPPSEYTWSRDIRVYAAMGDVLFPVEGAVVTATSLTPATVTSDVNGLCHVEVLTSVEATVTVTITADSYPDYSGSFPAFPAADRITIFLVEPVGMAWTRLAPASLSVGAGEAFTLGLYIDAQGNNLASYGISIFWDGSLLSVDTSIGINGVEAGADGFLTAASANTPGVLTTSGFDTTGIGPGNNLHLFTVHFVAGSNPGTVQLTVENDTLTNLTYNTIGAPNGSGAEVQISPSLSGDVNGDELVNIVDALMVAQYSVGLDPRGFNPAGADVNSDGTITIVDALMIAQYCVGLLDEL